MLIDPDEKYGKSDFSSSSTLIPERWKNSSGNFISVIFRVESPKTFFVFSRLSELLNTADFFLISLIDLPASFAFKTPNLISISLDTVLSPRIQLPLIIDVFLLTSTFKIIFSCSNDSPSIDLVMCADKNVGFYLVNESYSSGVYHEQKTKYLHRSIQNRSY